MRTRVCITVDTEFSIGGAFNDRSALPVAEQRVWCVTENRSHGLDFMLDCFERHSVKATFFVETLNRHYFRHDPMRDIAHHLHAAGHDVELHLHPCWDVFRHADWRKRARVRSTPGIDNFFKRSEDDSLRLIEDGLETFRKWGLPAPTVFRSGALQHDDALYRAQARAGMPFSSHVAVAVFDKAGPDYRLYSGRHERHGVIECPTLSFDDWKVPGKTHTKALTVTGTSFAETTMLLEQAHREGVEQVVILTHPFEYVQVLDAANTVLRPHAVNQQRLASLCAYLERNSDRFATCGVAKAAAAPMQASSSRNLRLRGSLLRALPRMAEQALYDRYGMWQLKRQAAVPGGVVVDAVALVAGADMRPVSRAA